MAGTDDSTRVPSWPVLPSHTMLEFHQTVSGGCLPLTGRKKKERERERKKKERKRKTRNIKRKNKNEKKKIKKKAIVSDSFLSSRQ